MGGRLMVGQFPLEEFIGVRLPASQPKIKKINPGQSEQSFKPRRFDKVYLDLV